MRVSVLRGKQRLLMRMFCETVLGRQEPDSSDIKVKGLLQVQSILLRDTFYQESQDQVVNKKGYAFNASISTDHITIATIQVFLPRVMKLKFSPCLTCEYLPNIRY